MVRWPKSLACVVLTLTPLAAFAKPIAFADGYTVMAEYGAGTMKEAQFFYAPRYYFSVGGGHEELESDVTRKSRSITYARLNYLAHRWNLDAAQANIFVWGGFGGGTGNTFAGTRVVGNVGGQADFETRRVYASVKTDLQYSSAFSHRTDTLQLGVAPYKHDYGGLATWFVVQVREYTGGIHRGVESAALVRLFKGGTWVEAGISNTGQLQAMLMVNF